MSFSAKMKLLGGEQVAHSMSPLVMREVFKATVLPEDRMSYTVHPFIPKEDISLPLQLYEVLEDGRERGVTAWAVTAPFKRAVLEIPRVTCEDNETSATGAANLLIASPFGWQAFNTDVFGVKASLEHQGVVVRDESVLVLGAGATAYSAIRAVLGMGARSVFVANRTVEKAETIAREFQTYSPAVQFTPLPLDTDDVAFAFAASEASLVVNATAPVRGYDFDTSLNPMAGFQFLAKATRACMDVNYHPRNSGFLMQARRDGVQTCISGEEMLVFQALGQFEILTGKYIDEATLHARSNRIKAALARERRRRYGLDPLD